MKLRLNNGLVNEAEMPTFPGILKKSKWLRRQDCKTESTPITWLGYTLIHTPGQICKHHHGSENWMPRLSTVHLGVLIPIHQKAKAAVMSNWYVENKEDYFWNPRESLGHLLELSYLIPWSKNNKVRTAKISDPTEWISPTKVRTTHPVQCWHTPNEIGK